MAQIHNPHTERELQPGEAIAVRWAELAATDHTRVDDAFMAEVRTHFDEAQVMELGMMIGQYIGFGRLLVQVGLDKGACELYVPDLGD